VGHEADGAARIERGDDARMARDRRQTQHRDNDEPEHHHRPERAAYFLRPEALRGEQAQKNGHRHRHDEGFERGRHRIDALDRAQHRDGRRDDTVPIDESGPEQSHPGQELEAARKGVRTDERHQRQNSSFAAIVSPHDEHAVLMEIVAIKVHTISESTPSALCAVNCPPVACTTVCREYRGLVPRSPKTTPSALSMAHRAGRAE